MEMVELDERCEALCPFETAWERRARSASFVLDRLQVKARCVLRKGHSGKHMAPDPGEERWAGDARFCGGATAGQGPGGY